MFHQHVRLRCSFVWWFFLGNDGECDVVLSKRHKKALAQKCFVFGMIVTYTLKPYWRVVTAVSS